MAIVGLVVQNHNGNVLFQNVREYLSHEKANIASKAFIDQITSYDDAFISRGTTSHLTGSIVVLNMYRIYYMILNELYILAISQANDNPYEGGLYLSRAKRVLLAVSKDLIEAQIQRKYSEVYFALERVLFGEDGVEVLTQRLSDVQPHNISNRIDGQDELSPHQGSGSLSSSGNGLTSSGIQSGSSSSSGGGGGLVGLTFGSSNASTGGVTPGFGVCVGGRLLDNPLNVVSLGLPPTLSRKTTYHHHEYSQFDSLCKLDGLSLGDRILTQSDALPKTDKNIYDPPAQVKWGGTSAPAGYPSSSTSRVGTNRIMFTLRHPSAHAGTNASERSPTDGNTNADDDSMMSLNSSTGTSPLSMSGSNGGGNQASNSPNSAGSPDQTSGGGVAIDGSGSSSPPEQLPETTGRKYSISHVTLKRSPPVNNNSSDDAASSSSPLVSSPKTSSFIDPIKPDTSMNQSSSPNDQNNNPTSTSTKRDHHSSVSIPIKSKIII